MGLMALLDLWVLFSPIPWLVITGAAFAAGQPGGEKGLDVSDGIDKIKAWVPGVYQFAVRTIIGSKVIFILLALLPVAGNQGTTAIILGTVLPVIIGSSVADGSWKGHPFTRTIYLACSWLLTGSVAYWAAVTVWPDLRPFKAKAITSEMETKIRQQHEATLRLALEGAGPIKGIAQKIEEMDGHLTLEERLARLTPEERQAWQAASGNAAERALSSLAKGASAAHKAALEKWGSKDGSPATNKDTAPQSSIPLIGKWEGVYTPSSSSQPVLVGYFEKGTYCLIGNRLYEYRTQVARVDGKEDFYKMNFRGEYVDYGFSVNSYVPRPNEGAIPFPGHPYAYGAVIVLVNDQKMYAADGRKFSVPDGGRLTLDVNIASNTGDRRGVGGHKLKVEKC